jgi:hypothetical protein
MNKQGPKPKLRLWEPYGGEFEDCAANGRTVEQILHVPSTTSEGCSLSVGCAASLGVGE